MRRGLVAILVLVAFNLEAATESRTSQSQRFAMRSWHNGEHAVWVNVSVTDLAVRMRSAVTNGDEVALLVEQAAAKRSQVPLIDTAARRVNRHGLYHVELLEPVSRATLAGLAADVARTPEVLQAYPVLTRMSGRAFYDEHLVVTAQPGQLEALLAKLLPSVDGELVRRARVRDTALVRVGTRFAFDALEAARWLRGFSDLAVAEPNLYKEMELRAMVDDPLLPTQWHLFRSSNDTTPGAGSIHADAAWDVTLGEASVVIAVADTGTDIAHEDLVENIVGGFDAADNDDDPNAECTEYPATESEAPSCPSSRPYRESHGTAVCGVAAARGDNDIGVSGVCPRCSLMPIRLLDSSYEESLDSLTAAETFIRAADEGAAVINNSWGPGYSRYFPLSAAERAGLRYARLEGRDGLGTVVLFASGNDTADVATDAYARSADIIAVGGTTNLDDWAYYSNWGVELDVTAPTLGGAVQQDNYGIGTTDVTDGDGYDATSYSDGFSGTSASSPVASGLAGLILSANPNLTADQVRILMTSTADKVTADKVDWQEIFGEDIETLWAYDGAGHSLGFGWGRINAGAAVEAALDPTAQGGVCTADCDCDADNRCRITCASQADCPDGSVCTDKGVCEAPRPGPNDVGEPCNADCPYCVGAIDSELAASELCTDVCETSDDCPGGFVCRQLEANDPKLCVIGVETTGQPSDFRRCFDYLYFSFLTVESDAGQLYCTDMCIADDADTCPVGFHCGQARCECTEEMGGFWCISYTCTEAAVGANWDTDLCLPDPGFGDLCETDLDCKLGDYCGPLHQCRIDDREGCIACTECEEDADCGPRGWCQDLDDGLGPKCLIACDTDGSCPGNAACTTVPIGRRNREYDVCVQPWEADGGGCDEDWTCEVGCRDDLPCAEGEICTQIGRCIADPELAKKKKKKDPSGCAALTPGFALLAPLVLVGRRRRR